MCPLNRGFSITVWPWFGRFLKEVSAITKCPLYGHVRYGQVWVYLRLNFPSNFEIEDMVLSSVKEVNNEDIEKDRTWDRHCMKSVRLRSILVRVVPHSDWIPRDISYLSVFSPNVGKYGSEKQIPNTDTFARSEKPVEI